MSGAAAGVIGPVVDGLLTSLSWRWIFLINLPIGITATAQLLTDAREVGVAGSTAQFGEAPDPLAQFPDWDGFVGPLGEGAEQLELTVRELHELACHRRGASTWVDAQVADEERWPCRGAASGTGGECVDGGVDQRW